VLLQQIAQTSESLFRIIQLIPSKKAEPFKNGLQGPVMNGTGDRGLGIGTKVGERDI